MVFLRPAPGLVSPRGDELSGLRVAWRLALLLLPALALLLLLLAAPASLAEPFATTALLASATGASLAPLRAATLLALLLRTLVALST